MSSTHVLNPGDWTLSPAQTPVGKTRRSAAASADDLRLEQFLSKKVTVESIHVASPAPARRGASLPPLDLAVKGSTSEGRVVAVRHASGALTFHAPVEVVRPRSTRGARSTSAKNKSAGEFRFVIDPGVAPVGTARRGIVSRAIKVVVLKIATKIADAILPRAVTAWEKRSWASKGLAEGWFEIDAASLRSGSLRAATPRPAAAKRGRALLLLHGTFSHAAGAFRGLADHGFFERVAPIYGSAMYAFNHFSLGKSPEDNARDLLDGLPAAGMSFDVITHSRGGLVLRNLVERSESLGEHARRFRLGNGLMVACPSKGTPLATPESIASSVSWIANLVEMFPDNPLTTAIDWVAEAIAWIGARVVTIPGLAAMDAKGVAMRELNAVRPDLDVSYSALVANYEPEARWIARLADLAVDGFFGGTNDLVVPTSGGWQIGPTATENDAIPDERIGAFGDSGNIVSTIGPIHHLNIFDTPASSTFAAKAVLGEPQELGSSARGGPRRAAARSSDAGRESAARREDPQEPARAKRSAVRMSIASPTFSDVLSLAVIEPAVDGKSTGSPTGLSQIVASYGGARVVAPFRTTGGERGALFAKIMQRHAEIRAYIDQESDVKMPSDDALREFGIHLFEAMFPGQIKRLYDVARARERSTALNILFTSMTAWVADLPWEYAFDVDRRTYLATEDVHFVRNVMTAVPAERIEPRGGPLRILVVGAQPTGETPLSITEEDAVIRRGFESLGALAEVHTLPDATPGALHAKVLTNTYDVVHFIGHGMFDQCSRSSLLRFENAAGRRHDIGARSVRELLCGRGVRLVFLNACESARGGSADGEDSVAQALVKGGMVAVVANQFSVLDVSATEFAQNFYWWIAQGYSLGRAMREARIAINYSTDGENLDWAIPVLFARDPESSICLASERSDHVPLLSAIAPTRAKAEDRRGARVRDVGVWDMVGRFPHLDDALEAMNRVQERFRFKTVSLSVPITAMKKVKGTRQFDVDVASRRLRNAVRELDLDHLLCIVEDPLSFETEVDGQKQVFWNYYGWWPDSPDEKNPLVFFSAGFEDLPTSGVAANRAVANASVLGLIGSLTGVSTSEKVPKHSILNHNAERDIEWVIGHLKIDAKARAAIAVGKNGVKQGTKRLTAEELVALNKLLDAFW